MNSPNPLNDPQRNRLHIAIIAVTTVATILISLYYLFSGSFIVFQNLFYVPIILSCMYYTMRGFIYSVCLAMLYMLLILVFTSEHGIMMQALVRVVLFIAIAGVVTFLSIQRKRAEEANEKAELKARNRQIQKAESLGRMAGAIAHHFNNQLGVVIGNLELSMMELPPGVRPRAYITAAMKASNKAAEMSGLMLTYLGQSFDKREPLDLSAVCRRNLPMIQAVMPGKEILETDLPSPGPVIMANENQIRQVMTNLITNAWEAFADGRGAIHLGVKTVYPSDIHATHLFPIDWQPQDNAYVCLEVTDTGSGIADKDIEKLFDPFFSSKFTGRGMGLPVVLGIVRTHSGAITVESKPGRGSTFRVFFPVSAEEVPR